MRKLIVTEWMSLDGIFDSASMEQWFNPYHSDSRAKSIQDTINDCEIMLYGRKTYEMLFPYWSRFRNNEMGVAEKLNKVKKYLVSTTVKEGSWENTTVIRQDVEKEITVLKKQSDGGNMLVQGSASLVKTLLMAGLVDEFKFLVHPHIVGTDGSFFKELSSGLELTNNQELENGVLRLCYKPKK